MKLKNKTKFLLVLGIIFIAFLLFNTNVKASTGLVEKGNPNSNSLDNIPSTISLDLKEVEFEKADQIVLNKVISILKEEGIDIKDVSDTNWWEDITSDNNIVLDVNLDIPNIKKIKVSFSNYGDSYDTIASKEITVSYSNTSNYNEKDKKYVEDIINNKLPKSDIAWTDGIVEEPYYMDEKEHELGTSFDNDIIKTFEKLTGLTFISTGMGTGGGINPFNDSNMGTYFAFKDEICYDIIHVRYTPPTKITVPNNIEDTESAYISYATPKIEEYLKTYDGGSYSGKITLEK